MLPIRPRSFREGCLSCRKEVSNPTSLGDRWLRAAHLPTKLFFPYNLYPISAGGEIYPSHFPLPLGQMGVRRTSSEDQNRPLAVPWPPFFRRWFSIVFWFNFWWISCPKMVPNVQKSIASWSCLFFFVCLMDYWSILVLIVDAPSSKIIKKTIGFYSIATIEVFSSWNPFGVRFGCQLGSILAPKFVQNQSQERSRTYQ